MHATLNYNYYHYNWKDWAEYALKLILKGIIICYLFYDSWNALILLLPLAYIDYHSMKKEKIKNQKRQITLQFKAMIEAMTTSLNAGYSLESAFHSVKKDLQLVYEEKEMIFKEIDIISAGLKRNTPLEELLKDFGERSGVEDIRNFANVVTAAKKSGGNLIRIIQKTVNSISDKLTVEEEIETLITGKKLEQRIMMLMPYGIMFYMRVSNGEFFSVLYHNVPGIFVMTVFLIVIYIADLWARSIMEIRI